MIVLCLCICVQQTYVCMSSRNVGFCFAAIPYDGEWIGWRGMNGGTDRSVWLE